MPQDLVVEQVMDGYSGRCSLYMSWSPPSNIAKRDLNEFLVYVNGTNRQNKTNDINKTLTLSVYPVCNCGGHRVSVHAVNRCGRIGQSTPVIVLNQNPADVLERECVNELTTDPTCSYEATAESGARLNRSKNCHFCLQ